MKLGSAKRAALSRKGNGESPSLRLLNVAKYTVFEVNRRFDFVDTFFYISRMPSGWFCLGGENVRIPMWLPTAPFVRSSLTELRKKRNPGLKTKEEGMPIPIRRDEVQRLIRDEGAQLVEVLPPPEYEEEHIEGAINIPLKDLDQQSTSRLDKDRPIIVY